MDESLILLMLILSSLHVCAVCPARICSTMNTGSDCSCEPTADTAAAAMTSVAYTSMGVQAQASELSLPTQAAIVETEEHWEQ